MGDSSSAAALAWERCVDAELGVVRTQLQRALREKHFTLIGDTVSTIEAVRGSQFAALVLQHDNLPMTAHIRLSPSETSCAISLQLEESGKLPSRFVGARSAYNRNFVDIQQYLDSVLAHLDPHVDLAPVVVETAPLGLGDQLGTAAGNLSKRIVQRANHFLEGRDTSTPEAWKKLDNIVFISSSGQAVVDDDKVQGFLVVAGLVASQPGAMPENLAHDVEAFAAHIESAIDASAGAESVRISIDDEEVKVLAFLALQGELREALPMRTLHVCTTCKQEKVTNPDYERMVARHSKLRSLTAGVGATFGRRGVSPFVMIGQLINAHKTDPDFVCSRCQTTNADEWVVTFCPQCGDRRQEAVLRKCAKCNYDFRNSVPVPELWQPIVVPQALEPSPPAALSAGTLSLSVPAPGPAPVPGGTVPPAIAPAQVQRPPTPATPPPNWYPDPSGRHAQRWWDGSSWTANVNDEIGQSVDLT